MDFVQFESRKKEHLELALDPNHQAVGFSDLERVSFLHDALPDFNYDEIKILPFSKVNSKSWNSKTPFYIAAMTAGHQNSLALNQVMAEACQNRGWVFCLGSQRRDFESPETGSKEWQKIRDRHPDLDLISNLGVTQLVKMGAARVAQLCRSLNINALAIHLNALQEVIQPEGTPWFSGALREIQDLAQNHDISLMIKETGCGISLSTAKKLSSVTGLFAIDVSGLGGTHWGRIEGQRAKNQDHQIKSAVAETFKNWGIPTVQSIQNVVLSGFKGQIWASGGLVSGLDAAKCLALGASRAGYAKAALQKALLGSDCLEQWMIQIEDELKTAMFCTGSKTIKDLDLEKVHIKKWN